MNEESKIISTHNLDCSSLENLAKDVANRLDCNVEYGYHQIHNGQHEFVQFGTVEINSNGNITTIYDMTNDETSECNYIVEQGEEAKLIYYDIIQVLPPMETEFNKAFRNFNTNGFKEAPYYLNVFKELKKLGADKIYFIKETFEPELDIVENTTSAAYLQTIKEKATYFEVV
ncbi:hypothetical protein ACFX5E_05230 [Flavobacterium sp. LS2P90]|uniref:Uncharacterized protein n=1 Tax=Flavobacterium xylosi TaxID=3230415 RepID=A0ABW6HUU6_9FLAO